MGVSERIKAIREEKRIKQIDIAATLNLDPSYYARLEKRGEKMSIEQLHGIADALGVSLGELLGIEGKGGAEDGERVKELEGRVKELEDRVKDKEFRIKAIEKERMTLEVLIFQSLSDGINHSIKVSDYQNFIQNNPWLIILFSGISFNSLKIADPLWNRFWRKAFSKFVKDSKDSILSTGEVMLGETYFSLISNSPTEGTLDELMEWVFNPDNEVETVAFYVYLQNKIGE